MSRRPLVLAWCDFQPRTTALASELGGEAHFVKGGRGGHGLGLPIRYLRHAAETWLLLNRRDPSAVVAISPPVLAPLVAAAWCAWRRRPLIIDCHTDAFHGPRWGWTRPLHKRLARRCRAVLLHTKAMRDEAAGWGAPALLLPDDIPSAALAEAVPAAPRPRVVVAGALDPQEPVAEALSAAALMPSVEFRFTGDFNRVPVAVRRAAPANAVFTGWLDYPRFLGELRAATVVAAFSRDPGIMNRAAYEAIGLGRPLVLTDWPGLREGFADAAFYCANEGEAMAAALSQALQETDALIARSRAAQTRLRLEREAGLSQLRAALEPMRPRRRVLVVSQHPYPDNPTLRRNVERLAAEGAQVDVVCLSSPLGGQTDPEAGGRLRIYAVPLAHRRSTALRYPLEYAAFFAVSLAIVTVLGLRHRYDAVEVDNLPDFLVFSALIPRLRGARLLLFMYELMPEMTAARLRVGTDHAVVRFTRWLERVSGRWADSVVTVNEPCRRVLAERRVSRQPILVIPNTQPAPQASPVGDAGAEPVLVTHATLVERYGVQVAIKALGILRRDWPTATLEVLGEGEYRPALEELARELGLAEHVRFLGFLPWPAAMERIRRARAGIVPVLPDGYGHLLLPMKLLDYVAQGVPAVASRLLTIEEYFPPDAVAYFEPGDAEALAERIGELLRDPPRGRRQALRAREVLSSLDWDREVAPRYLTAMGIAK